MFVSCHNGGGDEAGRRVCLVRRPESRGGRWVGLWDGAGSVVRTGSAEGDALAKFCHGFRAARVGSSDLLWGQVWDSRRRWPFPAGLGLADVGMSLWWDGWGGGGISRECSSDRGGAGRCCGK